MNWKILQEQTIDALDHCHDNSLLDRHSPNLNARMPF